MITFNMQTLGLLPVGHHRVAPPALAFNPDRLDTDAWVQAARSFGAKYAVLTASHRSGFALWPTKSHNYSVAFSGQAGRDILGEFVASCRKFGISPGVFWTQRFNYYLGVPNNGIVDPAKAVQPVSQDAYDQMMNVQLAELATYGFTEFWINGAIEGTSVDALTKQLALSFPNATCHSCAGVPTDSQIRWVGTGEAGFAAQPSWSAVDNVNGTPSDGAGHHGDPHGKMYAPPSCDAVLREHCWFGGDAYPPGRCKLSNTSNLVRKYLTSVGRNCNLILNIAPDTHGMVGAEELAAYRAMGKAVSCLFSNPVASTTALSLPLNLSTGIIEWLLPVGVNVAAQGGNFSLVLEEDLKDGQLIGSYSLLCQASHVDSWQPCPMGELSGAIEKKIYPGIGHKRILLLALDAPLRGIRVVVKSNFAFGQQIPALRKISLHNWSDTRCILSATSGTAFKSDDSSTVGSGNLTPGGRSCYGCIGYCTYGNHDCFSHNDYGNTPVRKWHDVDAELGTQGRGWPSTEMGKAKYTRLPVKAKSIVDSTVWALGQMSAGLKTRFSTKAKDLWVHWKLNRNSSGDWLWPAAGHAGIDIYIEDEGLVGVGVHQRWATSSGNGPTMHGQDAVKHGLYSGLFNIPARSDGAARNFTLYLPLGTTVTSLAVGATTDGKDVPLSPLTPPVNSSLPGSEKPVLWYGTSIMHGAAAARPGMGWPQQAERMLGMEGVNLGFSGNGLMQPYYAASGLLSDIDASIVVIDCEYNMDGRCSPMETFNRTLVFIRSLKAKRPEMPVLLIEGHDHARAWISPPTALQQNQTREAYRRAYNQLLSEGMQGLFYGDGTLKLGGPIATFYEAQIGTCAGVHPVSLGLKHMARYVSGLIRDVLTGKAKATPQPSGGLWPPSTGATETYKLVSLEASRPVAVENHWLRDIGGIHTIEDHPTAKDYVYTDGSKLFVEGKGFGPDGSVNYWQRFPDYAQEPLAKAGDRGIWTLSTSPSGMLVRFTTDATSIAINVSRPQGGVDIDDIFAANGRSGFDVYAQDAALSAPEWRWAATEAGTSTQKQGSIVLPVPPGTRNYTVHLPVWVPVDGVSIGVPAGSKVSPLNQYSAGSRPILIWGSSIAQGGAVSNAGAIWPVNVGRIMKSPVLNYGFSGSCLMQLPVAEQLGAATFHGAGPKAVVMDCLPNMQQDTPGAVSNDTIAVLSVLEAKFPSVPILIVEGHEYTNNWIKVEQKANQDALEIAQAKAVKALQNRFHNLHYASAKAKLGDDLDVVQDSTGGIGVHPTQLAHLHMAEFVATELRALDIV